MNEQKLQLIYISAIGLIIFVEILFFYQAAYAVFDHGSCVRTSEYEFFVHALELLDYISH